MFDAIVSKIINVINTAVRAVGSIVARAPCLAAAAILAVFVVW